MFNCRKYFLVEQLARLGRQIQLFTDYTVAKMYLHFFSLFSLIGQ